MNGYLRALKQRQRRQEYADDRQSDVGVLLLLLQRVVALLLLLARLGMALLVALLGANRRDLGERVELVLELGAGFAQ